MFANSERKRNNLMADQQSEASAKPTTEPEFSPPGVPVAPTPPWMPTDPTAKRMPRKSWLQNTAEPEVELEWVRKGASKSLVAYVRFNQSGAPVRMITRHQYIYRNVTSGGQTRRTIVGVFLAIFDPEVRQRSSFRISATIGWALTNTSKGDVFDRERALEIAAVRAAQPLDETPLPPSLLFPAMFFATSVVRDCCRMSRALHSGRSEAVEAACDKAYPYPDFVDIAGLVPTPVMFPEAAETRYAHWDITPLFMDRAGNLSSWYVPQSREELARRLMASLRSGWWSPLTWPCKGQMFRNVLKRMEKLLRRMDCEARHAAFNGPLHPF